MFHISNICTTVGLKSFETQNYTQLDDYKHWTTKSLHVVAKCYKLTLAFTVGFVVLHIYNIIMKFFYILV